MKVFKIIISILYISLLGFYVYLSLSSGEKSGNMSSEFANFIAKILNFFGIKVEVNDEFHTFIRKLFGHFGYFVILGIVSLLFYVYVLSIKLKYKLIIHFGSGFLFAFLTEFLLEAITAGRGPSMIDVLIDYSGFSVSVFISLIFIFKGRKKKNSNIKDASI